jgi:hypothetical protein
MHENREISRTSRSKDRDRSAKAINRTVDMHVQETSDRAVVPVNRRTTKGNLPRRSGREGRGPRRTSLNFACARHRAGNVCPRDCAVCGRQHLYLMLLRRYAFTVRTVCVNAHVRICAGGAEQSASLPRQSVFGESPSAALLRQRGYTSK